MTTSRSITKWSAAKTTLNVECVSIRIRGNRDTNRLVVHPINDAGEKHPITNRSTALTAPFRRPDVSQESESRPIIQLISMVGFHLHWFAHSALCHARLYVNRRVFSAQQALEPRVQTRLVESCAVQVEHQCEASSSPFSPSRGQTTTLTQNPPRNPTRTPRLGPLPAAEAPTPSAVAQRSVASSRVSCGRMARSKLMKSFVFREPLPL